MNLTKQFNIDIRKKDYDPRIEIVKKKDTELISFNNHSWLLLNSCKHFVTYLKKNLIPTETGSKGKKL